MWQEFFRGLPTIPPSPEWVRFLESAPAMSDAEFTNMPEVQAELRRRTAIRMADPVVQAEFQRRVDEACKPWFDAMDRCPDPLDTVH